MLDLRHYVIASMDLLSFSLTTTPLCNACPVRYILTLIIHTFLPWPLARFIPISYVCWWTDSYRKHILLPVVWFYCLVLLKLLLPLLLVYLIIWRASFKIDLWKMGNIPWCTPYSHTQSHVTHPSIRSANKS